MVPCVQPLTHVGDSMDHVTDQLQQQSADRQYQAGFTKTSYPAPGVGLMWSSRLWSQALNLL